MTGNCSCRSGWEGANCDLDINECLNLSYCTGPHETCHNLNGSAECPCVIGFEKVYNICQGKLKCLQT